MPIDPLVRNQLKEYATRHFNLPADRFGLDKLAGDASTRQYYRVSLPDGGSYVIARYPEQVDAREHPTCQVTRLFLESRLPVPAILDVSESEGLMLLEDLGDMRLQDYLETASPEEQIAAYHRAIDLIVQIQDAAVLATQLNSIASKVAFDEEKLTWELRFFYKHFFEGYRKNIIPPDQKEVVQSEFVSIARELASCPRVLCHRDYHSRNLMLRNGDLFIIDHQDARMGPVSYDIASLLGDPYVVLSPSFQQELREYFLDARMKAGGSFLDADWPERFEREYQLMLLQRLLKATGTYAYQMAVLGNDVYLPYIPRSLERALTAIRRLDQFPAIRQHLEQCASAAA